MILDFAQDPPMFNWGGVLVPMSNLGEGAAVTLWCDTWDKEKYKTIHKNKDNNHISANKYQQMTGTEIAQHPNQSHLTATKHGQLEEVLNKYRELFKGKERKTPSMV